MSRSTNNPPVKRPIALKPALIAFSVMLFFSLLFLKPYFPKMIYYNFAKIYDYQHFPNRVVKTGKGQPWEINSASGIVYPAALEKQLKELKTTAVVVIQNGKLVFEKYDQEGAQDKISGSFSMAKSITAILTGFAFQDKAIPSLDTAMVEFIPEFGERVEGKISVKNLLMMSSGLNWNESYYNPLAITAEAYYGDDLYRTVFKQMLIRPPGKTFSYQSGSPQLLGMIVSRAVKAPLADYASEKLWKPLGAESEAQWSLDHEDGLEKAYCCFNATARDFARIGQFILQKGKWNGQQLLNEEYIASMITAHQLPDEKGNITDYYGYQWWIAQTEQGPVPYMRGILGQYIIVIPQKNAVVVRLGHKKGNKVGHTYEEVNALIDWALHDFK